MTDYEDDNVITYHQYWTAVSNVAKELHDTHKSHDAAYDAIDAAIADHNYIIYHWKCLYVLVHTANDDALFESLGETALEGLDSCWKVYEALARAAMTEDVRERLGRMYYEEDKEEDDE